MQYMVPSTDSVAHWVQVPRLVLAGTRRDFCNWAGEGKTLEAGRASHWPTLSDRKGRMCRYLRFILVYIWL